MKKLIALTLTLFLPAAIGLAATPPTLKYLPKQKDKTLTAQEYAAQGIPTRIGKPDDLTAIIQKLRSLAQYNPEQLPAYNSRKSGAFFTYLTAFDSISRIAASCKGYELKQLFLLNYYKAPVRLVDLYAARPDAANEHLLALCADLYARLLSYNLMEEQVTATGHSLEEAGIRATDRQRFSLPVKEALTKIHQYDGYDVDPYVHQLVRANLEDLETMVKQSKILDPQVVLGKEK